MEWASQCEGCALDPTSPCCNYVSSAVTMRPMRDGYSLYLTEESRSNETCPNCVGAESHAPKCGSPLYPDPHTSAELHPWTLCTDSVAMNFHICSCLPSCSLSKGGQTHVAVTHPKPWCTSDLSSGFISQCMWSVSAPFIKILSVPGIVVGTPPFPGIPVLVGLSNKL